MYLYKDLREELLNTTNLGMYLFDMTKLLLPLLTSFVIDRRIQASTDLDDDDDTMSTASRGKASERQE